MNDPTSKPQSSSIAEILAGMQAIINKNPIPKRLARHAYYNDKYALKAKEIIDYILLHRQPHKILAVDGESPNTLRQQWYEGCRYLRDQLDTPEKYYSNNLIHIKCRTEYDHIMIAPRASLRGSLLNAPSAPVDESWKMEYREWLDGNPVHLDKFHRKNILLTADDITWAHDQLTGIEALFLIKIEQREILIVRYDQPTTV